VTRLVRLLMRDQRCSVMPGRTAGAAGDLLPDGAWAGLYGWFSRWGTAIVERGGADDLDTVLRSVAAVDQP
jgi:hypothetical protein